MDVFTSAILDLATRRHLGELLTSSDVPFAFSFADLVTVRVQSFQRLIRVDPLSPVKVLPRG